MLFLNWFYCFFKENNRTLAYPMTCDFISLTQHSMTWTPKKNWLTWMPICKWPLYVIVKMLEKIEWKTTFSLLYLEILSLSLLGAWFINYSIIFFSRFCIFLERLKLIFLTRMDPWNHGPSGLWTHGRCSRAF